MLPLPAMKALEAKKARIALRAAMEAMTAMQPEKATRLINAAYDATQATLVAMKKLRIRKDKIARAPYWALKQKRAAAKQQRRWQDQHGEDRDAVGVYSGVTVYGKGAGKGAGNGAGKGYKPQVPIYARQPDICPCDECKFWRHGGRPQARTTNTQWPQQAETAASSRIALGGGFFIDPEVGLVEDVN